MRPLKKITAQILAQNQGRDRDRLLLKLASLRQDPFAFFRGTNPLFLSFLPRSHALFDAPRTLICGDLHLDNFGAFKGDNRLCYFDVNDFDEACLAPFTLDIVRCAASIKIAAPGLGLGRLRSDSLVRCFLERYSQSIADGKPRWIERSLAEGVFRALLKRAIRRTRRELLGRYTRLQYGERHIRIGSRALALQPGERAALKRFLSQYRLPGFGASFFKLLDAAHRVAGNGSLGLERYLLLIRGRGSPDQNFLLDLKLAAPSAAARWLANRQPRWSSDAQRVVTIQRILQATSPALLHAENLAGRPFVLKELQPSTDRLDLEGWRGKPRRIEQAILGMASVTAWAHLRGCGHYGAVSAEALQAYVAAGRWRAGVERISERAVRRMQSAWKIYAKDYDAGGVTAAAAKMAGPGRLRVG